MTNMTQGEILSALAPIETMISICEENCGRQYLVMNDVNMIMPFVNKAQKAAEKLSRFALDNFNSDDENKRELSRIVCYRFGIMHSNLNGIKFNGLIDDTSVDWLNNNIKSVKDLLDSINLVVPALPESANASSNDKEEQAARIKELEKENEQLREQVEQFKNKEKGTALGLNQGQAALFGLALANTFDFNFTNKKKELAPMLHKIFGWGESKLAYWLSTPCENKERDELANLFKDLCPKLYTTIMNRGELPK